MNLFLGYYLVALALALTVKALINGLFVEFGWIQPSYDSFKLTQDGVGIAVMVPIGVWVIVLLLAGSANFAFIRVARVPKLAFVLVSLVVLLMPYAALAIVRGKLQV